METLRKVTTSCLSQQENGFVQERAWHAWSCFYSWQPFYRTLSWNHWFTLKTSIQPQWPMDLPLCHPTTRSASFLSKEDQTFWSRLCCFLQLPLDFHLSPSVQEQAVLPSLSCIPILSIPRKHLSTILQFLESLHKYIAIFSSLQQCYYPLY